MPPAHWQAQPPTATGVARLPCWPQLRPIHPTAQVVLPCPAHPRSIPPRPTIGVGRGGSRVKAGTEKQTNRGTRRDALLEEGGVGSAAPAPAHAQENGSSEEALTVAMASPSGGSAGASSVPFLAERAQCSTPSFLPCIGGRDVAMFDCKEHRGDPVMRTSSDRRGMRVQCANAQKLQRRWRWKCLPPPPPPAHHQPHLALLLAAKQAAEQHPHGCLGAQRGAGASLECRRAC